MIDHDTFGQPIGPLLPDWTPPPLPPRTAITGRYCSLEPLDADRHVADLHEAFLGKEARRNWTYLAGEPPENIAAFRAWAQAAAAGSDPLFFAILDQPGGQACGIASFLRIDARMGCIEIGHLNFAPRLQRTPAATEAMRLMLGLVFDLGYRRCEWKCNALNAPSRAAALRLGFTFEGIFRQHMVVKGRNRDTAWFAVLDHEWPVLRAGFDAWLSPANFASDGRQRSSLAQLRQAAAGEVPPRPEGPRDRAGA